MYCAGHVCNAQQPGEKLRPNHRVEPVTFGHREPVKDHRDGLTVVVGEASHLNRPPGRVGHGCKGRLMIPIRARTIIACLAQRRVTLCRVVDLPLRQNDLSVDLPY